MKKVLLLVLMVSLLLVLAAPAFAGGGFNSSKFCKEFDDIHGDFDSHGECVRTANYLFKGSSNYGNAWCTFIDDFGFDNHGQCVTFYNS